MKTTLPRYYNREYTALWLCQALRAKPLCFAQIILKTANSTIEDRLSGVAEMPIPGAQRSVFHGDLLADFELGSRGDERQVWVDFLYPHSRKRTLLATC